MLETISAIVIKYWVEFLLGLIVAGGGFFLKRYVKLEKEDTDRKRDAHFKEIIDKIQEDNKTMIQSLVQEHHEINQRSEERYHEITEKVSAAI